MRAAFITNDLVTHQGRLIPGGCSYYRQLLPSRAAGSHVAFGKPAWAGEYGFGVAQASNNTALFGFDLVSIKLIMARWLPKQIELSKQLGQRVIIDVDDLHIDLHDDNLAKKMMDPDSNRVYNWEHYERAIQLADTVTVSTPLLYDYYIQHHPDVRLVRNGINAEQFTAHRHTTAKPVLGWVGQMQFRSGDIDTLKPWLGSFMREHDLTLHHSGSVPSARSFADAAGLDPERVTTEPMQPIHKYHTMFNFDIGLVPLTDIPFNRAKSNIKGLEYAASNIPFVAQALPEYSRLAIAGVGRVASTAREWEAHLLELLDYNTRKREAAQQRSIVQSQFTMGQAMQQWSEVFNDNPRQVDVPSIVVPYVHV